MAQKLQRETYYDVVDDLQRRITKLERTLGDIGRGQVFLPDSAANPAHTTGGGWLASSGGALVWVGPTTTTTVAPS